MTKSMWHPLQCFFSLLLFCIYFLSVESSVLCMPLFGMRRPLWAYGPHPISAVRVEVGGRKRHPCRDHFEICEDFCAIWTRCQSAPDSKGWQRYPTVQYGSLFNELLTVPRFNWCDIWAIYLWHFNEGWFSALPFTFLCYFLRVIYIFLL